jgi:hypothetical protein
MIVKTMSKLCGVLLSSVLGFESNPFLYKVHKPYKTSPFHRHHHLHRRMGDLCLTFVKEFIPMEFVVNVVVR